jgi:glucose/mannose-6-phosphate isomerase
VARRWKCQFNENSDVFANYETLPEMNHNAVVGVDQPHDLLMRQTLIFITSSEFDHSRVGLRHQLTADLFLHHNTHVEKFIPKGESRLAQMLHAILFGDYVSYYLAIAYQIDPMVIVPIDDLKSALASRN